MLFFFLGNGSIALLVCKAIQKRLVCLLKFHFNLSAISKEITVISLRCHNFDIFLDEFMAGIRCTSGCRRLSKTKYLTPNLGKGELAGEEVENNRRFDVGLESLQRPEYIHWPTAENCNPLENICLGSNILLRVDHEWTLTEVQMVIK